MKKITIRRSNSGTDFTLYLTGVDGEYTHPILSSLGSGHYHIFPNMKHIDLPSGASTADEIASYLTENMEKFFSNFVPMVHENKIQYATSSVLPIKDQENVASEEAHHKQTPVEPTAEKKTISMDDF